MSTHARGGPLRSLLGSVADEVVRESRRPVLLVRRAAPRQVRASLLTVTIDAFGRSGRTSRA